MTTTDLIPIPLLPHEAQHAAGYDSGLLWRTIEPQPDERSMTAHYVNGRGWEFRGAHDERQNVTVHQRGIQSPYQPNARLYVQEEWQALYIEGCEVIAYKASCPNDRFVFANPGTGTIQEIVVHEWRTAATTPDEAARTIIEITRVEVRRSWKVLGREMYGAGVFGAFSIPAKPFRKMHSLSMDRGDDPWGFLYHYEVKERR